MSKVFQEDIKEIVGETQIPWESIKNATFLITGATGLIGKVLIYALSYADKRYNLGLRIIARGRNAAKGEELVQNCGAEFVSGDIRESLLDNLTMDKLDYIIHCASITKSVDMVSRPVDVITTSIDGTRNVLELAKKKKSKSVVYLSSMEVYGQTTLKEVSEPDIGYIDLISPRSSYPESKRMCEGLCTAYFTQYGVPVKVARLAQTFGSGTSKDDPRVFAEFAKSVIAGENVVLRTEGKSQGNYCYISDAARGLLILLLKGENGGVYNISNPSASTTIREMAEMVANEICDGGTSVIVDIPPDIEKRGYAPESGFVMKADKLKILGWSPKYSLVDMYKRMIADWLENTDI